MSTNHAPRRAAALAAVVCASLPFSPRRADAQLTAAAASQIVEGCANHARGRKQSHAIAVYDDGGNPVATLRMDGNAPGIMEFAMQKAEAVARWRFSTGSGGSPKPRRCIAWPSSRPASSPCPWWAWR